MPTIIVPETVIVNTNRSDALGAEVATGVYVYQINADNLVDAKRLMLVK